MADKIKEVASIEIPDYECDEKVDLKVGINYTGSFRIMPNGTIKVKPYNLGSKPSNLTKIFDGDNFAILSSRRLYRIVFTFDKTDKASLKKKFQDVCLECFTQLCKIEL